MDTTDDDDVRGGPTEPRGVGPERGGPAGGREKGPGGMPDGTRVAGVDRPGQPTARDRGEGEELPEDEDDDLLGETDDSLEEPGRPPEPARR